MDAMIGDPNAVLSVELAFEGPPQPGVWGQVMRRAMAIAILLGIVFCFMTLWIHMVVSIVPGLNMPTSVLSFYCLKWVITLLCHCGIVALPFIHQENIFLLTSIKCCITIALIGGFATYIIAMTSTVAKTLADDLDPREIVEHVPTGQWMLFLFLIGLMGILSIIPFKEIMIIDYRLLFPMGTVTAHLINSFHTPQGAYVAKFYLDFSAAYIGLSMICSMLVNFTLLFGSIICWGFLYPYLESKKGQWYHADSLTSLDGSNGYKLYAAYGTGLTDWRCKTLKTGYMTLTSSQAVVMGQIFGAIIGPIINPCIYLAFETTAKPNAPIGSRQSEYPCPYSGIYCAIGLMGMGGVKELPQLCILFCLIAFFITIAIGSLIFVSQKKGWAVQSYVPSMTAIAMPFFTGSFFTIDMCLGYVLLLVWTKMNRRSAELLSSALAAGLICGEGLFQMPSAILSVFKLSVSTNMHEVHS